MYNPTQSFYYSSDCILPFVRDTSTNQPPTEDGFYTEEERISSNEAGDAGPKQKQRVLMKIPQSVIENAVGLAIFTTMRTGLWISGAGGSGVLVARQEDGSWSPPSGIMLHTAGLGFLVGVDIYDCVLVINNRKALESFTKVRATVGGEVSAVAGPMGVGGVLENDGKWKQANRPVFTYLKSRGFYAGVQIDGTVVIERTDENARFYGEEIGVSDILAGKVRHPPPELKLLMETLKAAEGRSDVDMQLLDQMEGEPAPGDVDVAPPGEGRIFGVPELDDPDPFGVLALEKEGLEIREAGTRSRPSSWQFEYHPKPSSPMFDKYYRKSMDSAPTGAINGSPLSSQPRWSVDSSATSSYVTSDHATQTSAPMTPIQDRPDFPTRINCEDEDRSPYDEIFDVDGPSTLSSYYNTSRRNSYFTTARQESILNDVNPNSRIGSRRVSELSSRSSSRMGSRSLSTVSYKSCDKKREEFMKSEDVSEVPLKDRVTMGGAVTAAGVGGKLSPPPLPPRSPRKSITDTTKEFESINLNK